MKKEAYLNISSFYQEKVLVINASKEGITHFLDLYAELEIPPAVIPLQDLHTPYRNGSLRPVINELTQDSDLIPHCVELYDRGYGRVQLELNIHFIEGNQKTPILCAGISGEAAFPSYSLTSLTMNREGWKEFLVILRHLRDKSQWFYVTTPQPAWSHIPFKLSTPYAGDPQDMPLLAIECVRLEPEEKLFLVACLDKKGVEEGLNGIDIRGNPTGLLFFSRRIEQFIESKEEMMLIHNTQTTHPLAKEVSYPDHTIQLRKVETNLTSSVLSFEYKKGAYDTLYIFGNNAGLKGLSDTFWTYAYKWDHEEFYKRAQNYPGDLTPGVLFGGEGFCSLGGWHLLGGAYVTHHQGGG